MKDETKPWLEQAKENFEDAMYLYTGSRYSMAVYCYKQALEKIFKAAIVEFGLKVPLKSHNLDALARETTLPIPEAWYEELKECVRYVVNQ